MASGAVDSATETINCIQDAIDTDGLMPLVKYRDFINNVEEFVFYLEQIYANMVEQYAELIETYELAAIKFHKEINKEIKQLQTEIYIIKNASKLYSVLLMISKTIKEEQNREEQNREEQNREEQNREEQ